MRSRNGRPQKGVSRPQFRNVLTANTDRGSVGPSAPGDCRRGSMQVPVAKLVVAHVARVRCRLNLPYRR